MSLKALQEYTFTSRYAKYIKEKKRRETWAECVNRVKNMMLEKYKDIPEVHEDIEWAYEQVRKKRVLGSQRAMQFGGKPILDKELRIFNCVSSYCDRLRFFQECTFLLLAGCGTGFSVQKHHIDKLPKLLKEKIEYKKFVIEDTIESWADSIGVLVSSYFEQAELFPEYNGHKITFDYSKIRPKGSPLSFGGKAPGPEPLKNALSHIKKLLDSAISNKQEKLKPIQAYDIIMYAADCVIAGGHRRSATICLFSEDDDEMMSAKTGNWFYENPQRGRSNNSVVLLKKELTKEKFSSIVENIKQFGEPAFLLVDDLEHLVNPCQSGDALLLTKDGVVCFDDVNIGDEIWSSEGWTKVINKQCTGIKPVFKFTTDGFCEVICDYAHFKGTLEHRVISNGEKVEISQTNTIDFFNDDSPSGFTFDMTLMNAKITNVEFISNEKVYDITVDNQSHTYWTGGCNVSNCVEISFYAYNNEGKSGWEACNLSTINGAKIKTKEDFLESCKVAAIIGTLQAGFTNTGYLGEVSKEIIEREALLGVSMTGIMDSPDICLNPEIQNEGANLVIETNKIIAKKIGINPCARATCIKPEGSASCVLGTSSGIHPHHSKRYIRRVQSNKQENIYDYFKKYNPRACEDSVWSENETDGVIGFCVQVPDKAKTKNQISAVELLKIVKNTQDNWVKSGKRIELCTKPWLTHNVSNTVSVKPEEWNDVIDYLYDNRESFCGVSLLPITGDKDYPQAPFTSIYTPEEMVKHYGDGVVFISGLIEQALELWEDNLWLACDSLLGKCNVKGSTKKDWIARCTKFANKYFQDDLRKLTYAMKDICNYKLWTELNLEYQDVNFENMIEEEDETKVTQDVACGGGSCELK